MHGKFPGFPKFRLTAQPLICWIVIVIIIDSEVSPLLDPGKTLKAKNERAHLSCFDIMVDIHGGTFEHDVVFHHGASPSLGVDGAESVCGDAISGSRSQFALEVFVAVKWRLL